MRTIAVVIPAFAVVAIAATAPQQPAHAPGELLPDEQIQQVLNRLTFGARPGDAERVRGMGIDKWIDLQLHPERIDDGAAEQLVSRYSIFNMKTQDIVRDYNALQQAQRQAKKAAGNDTTMDKQDDSSRRPHRKSQARRSRASKRSSSSGRCSRPRSRARSRQSVS